MVIGAGAVGSSTAWWLSHDGRSVLLAERFEPGHNRGSSHGAVRIFRFAYGTPEFVRMAQEALPLWRELEDDAGETLVEQFGAVDHGPPAVIDQIAAALAACGAPHERLGPSAAGERFPGLRFDESVLFHPDGGRCFADRTVSALQRRAAEHGADVRFGTPAHIITASDDEVRVDVAGETVVAGSVVVTAGAWTAEILAGAGAGPLPPLRVTNEQVVHFPPRDPEVAWPAFIHHASHGELAGYGLPAPGEGIKAGIHHDGPMVGADERTFELDDERVGRIVEYAERWIPGVDPVPQFAARCLYTTTPDERFVIERRGRVVVGSACSGHGFKFAPLTGRRLATFATER